MGLFKRREATFVWTAAILFGGLTLAIICCGPVIAVLIIRLSGYQGPIIGDRQDVLYFHNSTDEPVNVSILLVERQKNIRNVPLAPGETKTVYTYLGLPKDSDRRVMFEARNLSGELLFCKAYTYRELENQAWTVNVTADREPCPSGALSSRF